MSDTRGAVKRRIRLRIDDMNPNDRAIDDERMDILIEDRMHLLAQEVGLGAVWTTTLVTLAASTWQYTLPTSVQYERVMDVVLRSLATPLDRVTHAEMTALRDGGTATGDPTHYALFEDSSQQVNIWVYPTPTQVDYLDGLRAQIPTTLSSDSSAIPFSTPLLKALEKSVAAEAILLMDEESRAERKAVVDEVPNWKREVQRAIRLERVRLGNQKRSDVMPLRTV